MVPDLTWDEPEASVVLRGIFEREPEADYSLFWARMEKSTVLVGRNGRAEFRLFEDKHTANLEFA